MIKLPSASCKGFYRVEVLRPDGSVKSDIEFPNLITTAGIARIWTNFGEFSYYCVAGTGTTPPQVTDSALVNEVMRIGSGTYTDLRQSSTAPFYHQSQAVFTFAAAKQNYTIGELGVCNASGNVTLSSRALPRDTGGNVTTISVLTGEILRVTYILRMYFDMNKYEGSFEANGVTYNYVAMADRMNSAQYWHLANGYSWNPDSSGCSFEQRPADTTWANVGTINQNLSKAAEQTYNYNPTATNSGPTQTVKLVAALANANFPKGINVIHVGYAKGNYRSGPSYAILLDKYMPKTADMTLEFEIDVTLRANVP